MEKNADFNLYGHLSHKRALLQLTNGLDYIHSTGRVHGDIRPHNVFVYNLEILKWVLPVETNRELSVWSAPEQLRLAFSPPQQDTASDTFSAGCLFFFILMNGRLRLFGDETDNIITGNRINLYSTFFIFYNLK